MVSIHGENENNFFSSHFRVWIGADGSMMLGQVWIWSDGSMMNYMNWGGDGNPPLGKCAVTLFGKWYSELCDTQLGYICEKEITVDGR